LQEIKKFMIEDASKLAVKVAGAQGAGIYDLKMEAAAIIRKAARNLYVHYYRWKCLVSKRLNTSTLSGI